MVFRLIKNVNYSNRSILKRCKCSLLLQYMLGKCLIVFFVLIIIYHWNVKNLHHLLVPFFNMSKLLLSYPWCYQLDFKMDSKVNSPNLLISKIICFKSNPCCSLQNFWVKLLFIVKYRTKSQWR